MNAHAPASTAVILVPRLPKGVFSSIPQPFLLSVGNSPDVAVSVSADGDVFVRKASAVFIHDVCYAAIQTAVSSASSVSLMIKEDGYVVLSSQRHNAELSPASVSVIPTTCTATQKKTQLTHQDLSCLHPSLGSSEVVLVDLSHPSFVTLSPSSENGSVEVGPYGGQFVVAPLHVLEDADEEVPWKLALLSPSSSGHVQVDVARILPTPPPSPPVASISLGSSTSSPTSAAPLTSPMPMTLPSMPSMREVVTKQMEEQPLTPVSPPAQLEPELNEKVDAEPEHKEEEEEEWPEDEFALTPLPPQPNRGGLLRFLLTWLFRTVLAKVWGLLGHAGRSLGPPWIFAKEKQPVMAEAKIESTPSVTKEEESQPEEHHRTEDEHVAQAKDFEEIPSDSVPAGPEASPSDVTLADDMAEKADDLPTKIEETPSMGSVVPPFDGPVHISVVPRASPKCRFLADIHSNTVSLLVRAPHARRSLSELNVSLDGKKISDSGSTYRSSQLSEHVYLIGLDGPDDGARLEVALD